MKLARICRYAAAVLLVGLLVSCGKVPVYRWHSGNPTSFALADGRLVPVDASTTPRALMTAAAETGSVEVKDYGRLNITFRNDATAHRAHYESLGTYIGSYTPDTFPVATVKVAFLKSNSDDGFWVLQTNEGVFGEVEFLDFKDPVFIRDDLLWEPGEYDMMIARFEIGLGGAGGEWTFQPVRVTVPGYTDAELPDLLLREGIYARQYNGNNEFLLVGLEGPYEIRSTTYFMFRQEIRTAQVLEANWWEYADGTYVEGARINEDGMLTGGHPDDNPHVIPWYSGNIWFLNQPWGRYPPDLWADIPFQGLTIDEDTEALEIIVRWDLEGLVELWDFGDEGLQLVLAPDFMDRFSMEVRQIK